MTAAHHEAGRVAVRDALKSGGDVAQLLADLQRNRTPNTADILVGAFSYLTASHKVLHAAGLVPRRDAAELAPLLRCPRSQWSTPLQSARGQWSTSGRLDVMVSEVSAHRAALKFPEPKPATARRVVPFYR